ncbi:MAG: hypothetical protein P8Z41_12800, partial [Anaerolineales bacterium]
MMVFNPLFLVYVAIFALSIVGLMVNLSRIDVAGLPQRFGPCGHRLGPDPAEQSVMVPMVFD